MRTLLMLGRPHSSSVCTGAAARRRVIAVSGGCNHLAIGACAGDRSKRRLRAWKSCAAHHNMHEGLPQDTSGCTALGAY